ncbi:MAG TPA: triose-phosphate isomerase [Vicinamibacteria bacterium]|nr:triose-phosphate isomerase [Vicinamibacteria bacterium]
MRRKLIAGNWKMFKTVSEAVALVEEIRKGAAGAPGDTLVAPPYTSLVAAVAAAKGSPVAVAAQNMHFEKEGAFTGEVSAVMLKDVGVTHAILGHSERRQYFAETDEGVARKTKVALDNGLGPISCVGETLAEREAGRTMEVVGRQVDAILDAVSADEAKRVVIAYEPVWAIGTGKVATPEQAQEVHAFIRRRVAAKHGQAVADALRILYGGSVKPDNVKGLMALSDVDGALVGGASLKADSFLKLVHYDKQ